MTDQVARPRKQEQEPATDTITQLAPGVLRSELPTNLPGLGHVNCYILEDDRGVALVDPGLPTKESYAAIRARLAAVGVPLKRVHTVVITHSHHDHFGGAAWLRSETGAEIVTHRSFRLMWDPTEPPDVDVDDMPVLAATADSEPALPRRRAPWETTPWGGPGMNLPLRRRIGFKLSRVIPALRKAPVPTVRVEDAQTISLAGRDWIAVHTPGHTNDHLCLFDPTEGCMLCGDHVLPTITPHIGGMGGSADQLGTFFESLDKIATFGPDVKIALPAHGKPFTDLAGRTAEIKVHHEGRLQKLRDTSIELNRPASVMEMSTHLFRPQVQGMMADSETFAHLEHLRVAGEMTRRSNDGILEYVLTD